MKNIVKLFIVCMLIVVISGCGKKEVDPLAKPYYWLGDLHNFHNDINEKSGLIKIYTDYTIYTFKDNGTGTIRDITELSVNGYSEYTCNSYEEFNYENIENSNLIIEHKDGKKEIKGIEFKYDEKYQHNILYMEGKKYTPNEESPLEESPLYVDCSALDNK